MVIDRTGLTGIFDIELTWRPEPMPALAAGPGSQVRASPPIDPGAPDLFTALQEQWGVKLEPGTGPVPVLIIDSAAMPTED
jgi:uncharacterized protein (TIGR03435 family)